MATNEELAELIKQGHTELYNDLWEQMKKLLIFKASAFYSRYMQRLQARGVCLEDLEQECFFVLVDMVNAYELEKDIKLSSYVNYLMKNRFKRHVLGFDSNNEDKDALNGARSLDDDLKGFAGEDITLSDTIEDETAAASFDEAEERIYTNQLHGALDRAMTEALTDEQRKIINLRYYRECNISETARACDMTFSKARKRECDALKALRDRNELKPYKELIKSNDSFLEDMAYGFTGLGSFKNKWASSEEFIIEMQEYLKESRKQTERDREYIRACREPEKT